MRSPLEGVGCHRHLAIKPGRSTRRPGRERASLGSKPRNGVCHDCIVKPYDQIVWLPYKRQKAQPRTRSFNRFIWTGLWEPNLRCFFSSNRNELYANVGLIDAASFSQLFVSPDEEMFTGKIQILRMHDVIPQLMDAITNCNIFFLPINFIIQSVFPSSSS